MNKAVKPKGKKPSREVSKGNLGSEGKYKSVTRKSGTRVSKTKTSEGKDRMVEKPSGKTKTVVKKKGMKRKVYKD